MKKLLLTGAALFVSGFWSLSAQAHVRVMDPPARSEHAGLTAQPCGNIPRGPSVATYLAGSEVEVSVEVPVAHNNRLFINISHDNAATNSQPRNC